MNLGRATGALEHLRPRPLSAARRWRAIAMAASAAVVLLGLPLIWFTGVVARTEFTFTAIESWVFGVPTAAAAGFLLIATALMVFRPGGVAGLLAYGAGLSCVAFAVLAWITADAVTGLVPTPGGADLVGIETGPGVVLLFVGGAVGTGAGLVEVVHRPTDHPLTSSTHAAAPVAADEDAEVGLDAVLSPSWAAEAVARWDDDGEDDGW